MKRVNGITVVIIGIFGVLAAGISAGETQGLFGEYFGTMNMTNLRVARIDPQVFFDWGTGSPHPRVGVDHFSICWTGFITPAQSGTYTFYVTADDGVRLWIDDVMLVNEWRDQAPTEYSATATLTAGNPHPIRIDYYENAGGAVIKLEWSGPGQSRAPIASTYLTPGEGMGDRLLDWYRNPYNGHYYRIIGPPMTWVEGRAQAEAMGGHLVTIRSAAENQWLVEMFRPVTGTAFIGANDIEEEGVWVWDETGETFWIGDADGSAVPGFYTNWNAGEPNDHGDDGEDVGSIYLNTGLWNDLNINRTHYCIVETTTGRINYDGPTPSFKYMLPGSEYQVSVSVRRPVGTVRYQWYKDGEEMPGKTSATLTIPYIAPDDAGLYTCEISDDAPATVYTAPAQLVVVDTLPALSVPGLACLAGLLALTAAWRRRKK